ncbi:hypothetical protein JCM14036_14090 [Desulfotomaculum defluvii]
MKLRKILLDGESESGRRFFMKLIKWLDNPKRLKYNNPDKLVKASGIKQGQIVLEIGCGSGFFTITAAKMLGDKGRLYSTDIHPLAVEETQKKVIQFGLKNVIVKRDDAMNSSFADATFDLILLYGVVPAPVISMKDISMEAHRLLKPGGVYAIWTQMPLWSPYSVIRYTSFEKIDKKDGVFRLRKI